MTRFLCPSGAAWFIPYWLTYLASTNDSNYDKGQNLEQKLRDIKVTNYEQQDLSKMIDDVKKKCDASADIGAYNHQNSFSFMENIVKAGDSNNVHMLGFQDKLLGKIETLKQAVEKIRKLSEADQTAYMEKEQLTFVDLQQYVLHEYKTLSDNGNWGPAKNPIDSKSLSLNQTDSAARHDRI